MLSIFPVCLILDYPGPRFKDSRETEPAGLLSRAGADGTSPCHVLGSSHVFARWSLAKAGGAASQAGFADLCGPWTLTGQV